MKSQEHTLTFNVSVADREFINKSSQPFQIMPAIPAVRSGVATARTGWLTDKMIDSYMKSDIEHNILIHTSYITRVFSSKQLTESLLQQYIKLAQKINTKYILVHGPYSSKECEFFDHGLELLQKLTKENPDIKFVVEIPAFTKELIKKTDHILDFIDKYIGKIVKSGFEVVIDTAHTFNNCLSNEEVIGLVKAYNEHITWIHFNGNLNVQASKDRHCPMYDKNNLIQDPIKFTQELLKVVKPTTIFVSETVDNDIKKWIKFCENTGLTLVEKTVVNKIGDVIE